MSCTQNVKNSEFAYNVFIVFLLTFIYATLTALLTYGNYRLSDDSFEYLTLARNLYWGEGFTRFGLPEYFRQPGYPYLVAMSLNIFSDIEFAGHFISWLGGVLTIPALYWTMRSILAPPYSLLGTALLALNGYFIKAGSTALTETSCTFFVVIAIGCLLRIMKENSGKAILLTVPFALFIGAAYLCRSEMIFLFGASLLMLIWFMRHKRLHTLICLPVAVIAFVIICLPYWMDKYKSTGHISVGGNSVGLLWYQSDLDERPPESMDPTWKPRAFDPQFPQRTHPMDFDLFTYVKINSTELMQRFLFNAISYVKPMLEILFFGMGFIPFIIGLFHAAKQIKKYEIAAITITFIPSFCLFFREGTDRLLIPYLPFATIFMALGLPRISEWIHAKFRQPLLSPNTLTIVLIALMAILPIGKMARHIKKEENDVYQDVAQVIRNHTKKNNIPKIMANHPAPAFYAHGRTLRIPDTSNYAKLIEQMNRYNVRFLIINREEDKCNFIEKQRQEQDKSQLKLLEIFANSIWLYKRVKQHTRL